MPEASIEGSTPPNWFSSGNSPTLAINSASSYTIVNHQSDHSLNGSRSVGISPHKLFFHDVLSFSVFGSIFSSIGPEISDLLLANGMSDWSLSCAHNVLKKGSMISQSFESWRDLINPSNNFPVYTLSAMQVCHGNNLLMKEAIRGIIVFIHLVPTCIIRELSKRHGNVFVFDPGKRFAWYYVISLLLYFTSSMCLTRHLMVILISKVDMTSSTSPTEGYFTHSIEEIEESRQAMIVKYESESLFEIGAVTVDTKNMLQRARNVMDPDLQELMKRLKQILNEKHYAALLNCKRWKMIADRAGEQSAVNTRRWSHANSALWVCVWAGKILEIRSRDPGRPDNWFLCLAFLEGCSMLKYLVTWDKYVGNLDCQKTKGALEKLMDFATTMAVTSNEDKRDNVAGKEMVSPPNKVKRLFLKLQSYRFSLWDKYLSKKRLCFCDKYQILKRSGPAANRLHLSFIATIQDIFHISQLNKSHGMYVHTSTKELEFEVEQEEMLDTRFTQSRHLDLVIKWKGVLELKNTWNAFFPFYNQFPIFHLEDKVCFKAGGY